MIDNPSQDLLSKTKRYMHERETWNKAGKPLRSDKEIFRIFTELCEPCEYFNRKSKKIGQCKICSCFLKPQSKSFNKIAWATTNCAADPPKWEAEIVLEENKKEEVDQKVDGQYEQLMFQIQTDKQANGLKMREAAKPNAQPPNQPKRGGCCGG